MTVGVGAQQLPAAGAEGGAAEIVHLGGEELPHGIDIAVRRDGGRFPVVPADALTEADAPDAAPFLRPDAPGFGIRPALGHILHAFRHGEDPAVPRQAILAFRQADLHQRRGEEAGKEIIRLRLPVMHVPASGHGFRGKIQGVVIRPRRFRGRRRFRGGGRRCGSGGGRRGGDCGKKLAAAAQAQRQNKAKQEGKGSLAPHGFLRDQDSGRPGQQMLP